MSKKKEGKTRKNSSTIVNWEMSRVDFLDLCKYDDCPNISAIGWWVERGEVLGGRMSSPIFPPPTKSVDQKIRDLGNVFEEKLRLFTTTKYSRAAHQHTTLSFQRESGRGGGEGCLFALLSMESDLFLTGSHLMVKKVSLNPLWILHHPPIYLLQPFQPPPHPLQPTILH